MTYAEIRAAVIEFVRTHPSGQVPLGLPFLDARSSTGRATDGEKAVAQQVFHELYLERIIITGAGPNSLGDGLMSWNFYRLTEYGRQALATPEYHPYDPEGYLALLRRQIPTVDAVIIRYLEESLACFKHNLLLASAVTLGCAAEKAMLLLVESFGNAMADAAKKAQYEKETDSWLISRKYAALWKRLEPLAGSLPRELGDDLHTILDRVFDLIRTTRNDAGHPTGKPMDRDAIRANFILFPSYCRRVYELIGYFAANVGKF